jgi:hypothetical protein
MLPPGGTEMTTRTVLAACDHATGSGGASATLSSATVPIARTASFRNVDLLETRLRQTIAAI